MLYNPQAQYVQRGEAIDYKNTSGSDVKGNSVVPLTNRIGVAGCDIPVGGTGSLHVIGVFDLPATSTEAYTVGQAVYWKENSITSEAAGAIPAGWVVDAKATAGTRVKVKIG
ncbi:DUF2190 family protein [Bacillus sp. B-jedd]|uniref:DUF2190 family protein n=1 Tax=Bacillus sp. B-jedd TaxID=1476857 RepID=UPI0005155818|nr:DUF2190 family protein [Bacillus sp. B-jedd]CEG29804.1 hypothetical protein BN1002_04765 [Bacillus sp. B-jedd]